MPWVPVLRIKPILWSSNMVCWKITHSVRWFPSGKGIPCGEVRHEVILALSKQNDWYKHKHQFWIVMQSQSKWNIVCAMHSIQNIIYRILYSVYIYIHTYIHSFIYIYIYTYIHFYHFYWHVMYLNWNYQSLFRRLVAWFFFISCTDLHGVVWLVF